MTGDLDPRLLGVDWHIIDVTCSCWRRNCRHQRELARLRVQTDQLDTLTETDVAWLVANGWQPT